jgi:integrase
LTLSEIDRFLSVAGRHELLYLIAFVTGARLGELGQLLWSDVHENEADPYIQLRSETTKNGKGRVQFLTREAAGMLKNARALSRIDRVFSQMPSRHTVNKHLELASIPKMTSDGRACFHSLRHSFTTTIAKMTKDARLAQRMADHADITTTQGYLRTEQSEHAAVMREFPSVRDGSERAVKHAVVGGKTGQFVSNEVPAVSSENGTQMTVNESLSAVQSTLVQGREIMEPGGI